jgi:hypothetical protein
LPVDHDERHANEEKRHVAVGVHAAPFDENLNLYPKDSTRYGLHQTSVTAGYDQDGGRTDQP